MKKVLTILAIGALVGVSAGTANATGGNGIPSVTICHKGETKTVLITELPGHLIHGDKVGACIPVVVTTPSPSPVVSPTPVVTPTPDDKDDSVFPDQIPAGDGPTGPQPALVIPDSLPATGAALPIASFAGLSALWYGLKRLRK